MAQHGSLLLSMAQHSRPPANHVASGGSGSVDVIDG
jgi:hypothetical protein